MSFQDTVADRRWLAKKQNPMSHLSMDGWKGGKLHVPPNEDDVFLASYADALQRKEPLFLIELRTAPHFKWHADLDMLLPREISQHQIMIILPIIQGVIKEHLGVSGKNKLKLLGLSAEAKTREDGTVKSGLHIIAPNLAVTVDDCIAIQQKCIGRLTEAISLVNDWGDAFDTSVYKGSGLRMLGSRKIEIRKCENGNEGTRKVDSGRAYAVSFVINGDGKMDNEQADTLKRRVHLAVKMSSIKSFDKLQQAAPHRSVAVLPVKRRMATHESVPSDLDIPGLLAYHLHASFAPVELGTMVRTPGGVAFSVKGCKFCMNVDREHSSSNIYIFLSTSGDLSQRCHCPKHSCSAYRSPSIPATSALMKKCGLVSSSGLPQSFQ